jgi:hypothetical protein
MCGIFAFNQNRHRAFSILSSNFNMRLPTLVSVMLLVVIIPTETMTGFGPFKIGYFSLRTNSSILHTCSSPLGVSPPRRYARIRNAAHRADLPWPQKALVTVSQPRLCISALAFMQRLGIEHGTHLSLEFWRTYVFCL